MEALQVENDHLSREIAILRETVKVITQLFISLLTFIIFPAGVGDEDWHPEADPERPGRQHQEAAGDAADKGRGKGGGGSGPPTNANGCTETGKVQLSVYSLSLYFLLIQFQNNPQSLVWVFLSFYAV